jgi:hypothetical protein
MQEKMVKMCEDAGARLIGPNGMGIIDNKNGIDTMFLDDVRITVMMVACRWWWSMLISSIIVSHRITLLNLFKHVKTS